MAVEKGKKGGGNAVKGEAAKPVTVEAMAVAKGVKPWAVAGMMRMMRFAPGKVLTESEFDAAVEKFMKKPMGGNCK